MAVLPFSTHDLAAGLSTPSTLAPGERLKVGIDTVAVDRVAESLAVFGERFTHRLFTAAERQAAESVPGQVSERYAARFAVKEAVIKALDLAEAGIGWREIELCSRTGRPPSLQLHGRVAERAAAAGVSEWQVSISHDGPSACAVVVALCGTLTALPTSTFNSPRGQASVCTFNPS